MTDTSLNIQEQNQDLGDFLKDRDLEGVLTCLADLGVKKREQLRFLTRTDVDGMGLSVIESRALMEVIESQKQSSAGPKNGADPRPNKPRNELTRSGLSCADGSSSVRAEDQGAKVRSEVGSHSFAPKSCIFAYLRDNGTPFKNQHQIRKFLLAAFDHGDDTQLISLLGSGMGLVRLREICGWPFSTRAGSRADMLSFQRAVVPLLRLVTKDEIQGSMLSQFLNPIYATLHGDEEFESRVLGCLEALGAARSVADPYYAEAAQQRDSGCGGEGRGAPGEKNPGPAWAPASWAAVFQPVARYCFQVVQRFRDSQRSPGTRALAARCRELVRDWNVAEAHPRAPFILSDLDLTLRIFDRVALQQARGEAREKEAERARRFAAPAAANRVFPDDGGNGPGGLRRGGLPRHDNDHASISDVNVAPTRGEALSLEPPYLPRNAPSAPHHLTGAGRLLDVHFRLLREDFLRALCAGVSRFCGQRAPAVRRGRFEYDGGESMFVFTSPRVVGVACDLSAGISFEVEFDDVAQNAGAPREKRRRFWERSKRLQHGCLVCLCWRGEAGAPQLIFGTVSGRDEDSLAPASAPQTQGAAARPPKPRVKLSTKCNGDEYDRVLFLRMLSPQNEQEAVMLQASDDYFSYEPVLKAIQGLDPAIFPFEAYLANADAAAVREIAQPAFLTQDTILDLRKLLSAEEVPFNALETMARVRVQDVQNRRHAWRLLREFSTLDEAQASAMESALTRELVLIQGPPGTGHHFPQTNSFRMNLNI